MLGVCIGAVGYKGDGKGMEGGTVMSSRLAFISSRQKGMHKGFGYRDARLQVGRSGSAPALLTSVPH